MLGSARCSPHMGFVLAGTPSPGAHLHHPDVTHHLHHGRMTDTIGQTWTMHAGWDAEQNVWLHPGQEMYVRVYNLTPVPVTLTETEDGPYWGWIDNRHSGPAGTPVEPSMVCHRRDLFVCCFGVPPEVEQERGRGRVVRLTIEATDPTWQPPTLDNAH